jgi:CRP-like cAMP-binding protein
MASAVGIVLSGSVLITDEDFFGNRNILSEIHPSELFGEALACAEAINTPVTVVANEQSNILLIDYRRIATTCRRSALTLSTVCVSLLSRTLRICLPKYATSDSRNSRLYNSFQRVVRRPQAAGSSLATC